jgi:hypothetical protein
VRTEPPEQGSSPSQCCTPWEMGPSAKIGSDGTASQVLHPSGVRSIVARVMIVAAEATSIMMKQ